MAAINDNIAALDKSVIEICNKLVDDSQRNTMSIEQQFNAAVNVIRNLPKNGPFQPSDEVKLKFYALYKQATEGPNETPKPAFYSVVNKYKWDAWKRLGNMSKEKAMESYVEELKNIVETMSLNEDVTDFYEVVDPSSGEGNGNGSSNNDSSPLGINEQLALAVVRLQQSMEHVINRVDNLESILAKQRKQLKSKPWWQFTDVSTQTMIIFFIWPFIVHWIMLKLHKRRS